jgi:fatty-acyl-CoA synthase
MPPSGLVERLLALDGPELNFLAADDLLVVAQRRSRIALRSRALQAARVLTYHGAFPGQRAVIAVDNSELAVAWILGAFACGAIAVPQPGQEGWRRRTSLIERLRSTIKDCSPAVVVAPAPMLARLACLGVPMGTALVPDLPESSPLADAPLPRRAEETAFIQYTAGSTGNPKGVVVSLENLEANIDSIGRAVQVSPNDRVLSWLPLHHDMGLVGALLFSLYWRLGFFLGTPVSFMFRPDDWLRAISQHRATLSPAPHFAYSLCAHKVPDSALEGIDLTSWRLALDGSEPIRPETVQLFTQRFARQGFAPTAYFPVYGLAEATLAVCTPVVGEVTHVDHVLRTSLTQGRAEAALASDADAAAFVSVGQAVPGHQIEVIDPQSGALLGERQLGEICVRGPSVTQRYFHDPPTARRPRLATGDLGYVADGRSYIIDRSKDIIIRAGETFYPSDLERVAEAASALRRGRTVAFSVPPTGHGVERIVLAGELRKRRRAQAAATEIRRLIRDRCDLELDDVVLLPPRSLPRTPSGKLMRHRVRDAYMRGALVRPSVMSRWLERLLGGAMRPANRVTRSEPPSQSRD